MQNDRGLPAHPSLPRAPHLAYAGAQIAPYSRQQYQQYPQAQATLTNTTPSSSLYQHYVSSHYAQAYMQGQPPIGWPSVAQTQSYTPVAGPSTQNFASHPSARWAQPGNVRCKKPGCTFIGSHKSVETHMMDRHLIYPPGWENRKRKDDWDADPSLKGYAIYFWGH